MIISTCYKCSDLILIKLLDIIKNDIRDKIWLKQYQIFNYAILLILLTPEIY
jgi:hypothetical protein